MATKVNTKDVAGNIDFSAKAEPSLVGTDVNMTSWAFSQYVAKAFNWIKEQLGLKVNTSQKIEYTKSDTQEASGVTKDIPAFLSSYAGNIAELFSQLSTLGLVGTWSSDTVTLAFTYSDTQTFYGTTISGHGIPSPKFVSVSLASTGEKIHVTTTIDTDGSVIISSLTNFDINNPLKVIILG